VSNAGPCAAGARREVAGPAELEQSALEEHSRRKEGSRRHEEEGRGEEGGQGAGKGLQQGSAMGGSRLGVCHGGVSARRPNQGRWSSLPWAKKGRGGSRLGRRIEEEGLGAMERKGVELPALCLLQP
jgi:hypothetical protein